MSPFGYHKDLTTKAYNTWFEGKEMADSDFSKDESALSSLLGLYERIQILISRKMVDIETIDRLYGFRFFVLVKNSYVHRKVFDHQSLWIDLKIL
jgi:TRAP-type uncharacterized transport system substrate-binding protein